MSSSTRKMKKGYQKKTLQEQLGADERFPLELYFNQQQIDEFAERVHKNEPLDQWQIDSIVDHRLITFIGLQSRTPMDIYYIEQAIESTDQELQDQLEDMRQRKRKYGLNNNKDNDGESSGLLTPLRTQSAMERETSSDKMRSQCKSKKNQPDCHIDPSTYSRIERTYNGSIHILIFIDLIHPNSSAGRSNPSDPLTMTEKRNKRSQRWYKIQWQGWPNCYATWQRESRDLTTHIRAYQSSISRVPSVTNNPRLNVGSMGFDIDYWKKHYGSTYLKLIDGVSNAQACAEYCFYFFCRFEIMGKRIHPGRPKVPQIKTIADFGFGYGYLLREFCAVFKPDLVYGLEPSETAFKLFSDRLRKEKAGDRDICPFWTRNNDRGDYDHIFQHTHIKLEQIDLVSYCHRELLTANHLRSNKEEYFKLIDEGKDAMDERLWHFNDDDQSESLLMMSNIERSIQEMPALAYRLRCIKELERSGVKKEKCEEETNVNESEEGEELITSDSSASTIDLDSTATHKGKKRSLNAQAETDFYDSGIEQSDARYQRRIKRRASIQSSDSSSVSIPSSYHSSAFGLSPLVSRRSHRSIHWKKEQNLWRQWFNNYDSIEMKGKKMKKKNMFKSWEGTFDLGLFVSVGQYLDDTSFELVMWFLSIFCHHLYFDCPSLAEYTKMEEKGVFVDDKAYKRPKVWYERIITKYWRIVSNSILESKYTYDTADTSNVPNLIFHIG